MKLRCTLNSRIVNALNPDDENEYQHEIKGSTVGCVRTTMRTPPALGFNRDYVTCLILFTAEVNMLSLFLVHKRDPSRIKVTYFIKWMLDCHPAGSGRVGVINHSIMELIKCNIV